MSDFNNNERVAVTGATGYLAEALIQTLVQRGHKINAIARNEGKLVELKKKYNDIEIFPCPVEDHCLLKKALQGCEGVYHLASFKDVNLAEIHALKTIQSNVIGTLNLLKLSMELPSIKFVVSTSTDKAVQVSGVYGATKLLIERLFHEFHEINGNKCAYRLVRYGNIFYSTGSVLTKWKKSLQEGCNIVLTDPKATRFFLSRDQAVSLIHQCVVEAKSPLALYPEMKSIEMGVLLDCMIEKYANSKPCISVIGLQPGENFHELITPSKSSFDAVRWTKEELMAII